VPKGFSKKKSVTHPTDGNSFFLLRFADRDSIFFREGGGQSQLPFVGVQIFFGTALKASLICRSLPGYRL